MVDDSPKPIPPRSGSIFLRIVWMVSLPAVLVCVLLLADEQAWTFGRYDLALLVIVAAALGARVVDGMWLGGTTADGRPVTRSHVFGYSVRLVLLSMVGWVVANSITI